MYTFCFPSLALLFFFSLVRKRGFLLARSWLCFLVFGSLYLEKLHHFPKRQLFLHNSCFRRHHTVPRRLFCILARPSFLTYPPLPLPETVSFLKTIFYPTQYCTAPHPLISQITKSNYQFPQFQNQIINIELSDIKWNPNI